MGMTKKVCQYKGDWNGACLANEFSETPTALREEVDAQATLIVHLQKENQELFGKLNAVKVDDLTTWEWKEVECSLEHWIDYLTTYTMNYGKDLDYKLRVKELRNKIRGRGSDGDN